MRPPELGKPTSDHVGIERIPFRLLGRIAVLEPAGIEEVADKLADNWMHTILHVQHGDQRRRKRLGYLDLENIAAHDLSYVILFRFHNLEICLGM